MNLSVEHLDYLDSAALFALVAEQEWSIFLDSGVINGQAPVTKHADFDVLAIKPLITLISEDDRTVITDVDDTKELLGDPLDILKNILNDFCVEKADISSEDVPAYLPGALGYCSYDLARRYEALPEIASNEEKLPDMAMGIYTCIVVVDHRAKTTLLVSILEEDSEDFTTNVAQQWKGLIEQQKGNVTARVNDHSDLLKSAEMLENMSRQDYQERFDKVRQYIVDGDCYQINLAKQFSSPVTGSAWQTYHYLRELSPAPYGAYLNLPFSQVLSNSPESFIQCRDRKVVTSPIKGTRPRIHENKVRDKAIATELLNSAKDRAENLMIVDLMRNDLSTCCELGSVATPKLFSLHSFANVHHLISTITGILKQDTHSLDLLRNCFPGGSITGAPKIRAMQIIEELEPHRRGLYCGAIAYIGLDGNMETNIAIRTIVVKDNIARYSAGGGLVIDSDADEEYQEIIDKAKMMTEVIFG